MIRWDPDETPEKVKVSSLGWVLATARGLLLGTVTYGGLVLLLLARLVEAPFFAPHRPITPYITQAVCRLAFVILGIRYQVQGRPMAHRGAIVANHSSWLDIFALNACQRVYFVSKSEVSGWPAIGWLARATGTVFIARNAKEAKGQQAVFEDRIRSGHRLLFFPEGTSTDGRRVLPFKPTLFAAFYSHGLEHVMQIQPVTVLYHAPPGRDPRFYGWWGTMDLAPHLLLTLAAPRQGRVEVVFHDPVRVDDFRSRKELSSHCENEIRATLIKAGLSAD